MVQRVEAWVHIIGLVSAYTAAEKQYWELRCTKSYIVFFSNELHTIILTVFMTVVHRKLILALLMNWLLWVQLEIWHGWDKWWTDFFNKMRWLKCAKIYNQGYHQFKISMWNIYLMGVENVWNGKTNTDMKTRMWNMISSPATPTVCLELKSENVQSRNVTLSMPSQSKK